MRSLNKKGFTLVELLAVIVVLAIIMIIAMPNVLNAMTGARQGAFKTYAKKIIGAAQGQYQTDDLLGQLSSKAVATCSNGTACYCYDLQQLGFTSAYNSSYNGYVIIVENSNRVPEYYVTLSDKTVSFKDLTLSSVESVTDFDTPNFAAYQNCPSTTSLTGPS